MDCGTITGDLAKSEFFGHRKGTFTGAYGDRYGLFQVADGGTLFLDEIGNLSPETQMLLLRALQERRYKPVGSTQEYTFDVRLVAATNENLERAISEGRFRDFKRRPVHMPAVSRLMYPAVRADTYARVVSGTLQPAVRKSSLPQ